MFAIFIKSAKMATPGPEINIFWNRGYDIKILGHDVTSKTLLCDSNDIVDLFMWPNFGNSDISIREVIITSVL